MRILIAEDDSVLADGLSRSLRQSGYAVDVVKNGDDADSALVAQNFDLLILDLGLPKLSGLDVLKRMRARNSRLPVLILTAADSVETRVKALDLGADDFMAKPFALSELEARLRALVRRGASGGAAVTKHGPLSFDQAGRTTFLYDKPVDLSARELGLLEILVQRAERLVSKEQLVDHLCEWGEEVVVASIANAPFDHALETSELLLARQVQLGNGGEEEKKITQDVSTLENLAILDQLKEVS